VLVGCAIGALYFGWLGAVPLLEPDEGRYAEIPREMLASGDLVVPRLNGVLYFEKPPLCYWLVAGSARAFGQGEAASRLPSALAGVLGIVLAGWLAARMAGPAAGLWTAVALASAPLYLALARLTTVDMTVTLMITATLTFAWFGLQDRSPRTRRWWWRAAAVAAALAVLAKGLIGVLIPGAIVVLFLLATRALKRVAEIPWLSAGALFALVAAPWHLAIASRQPDFAWFYFVHEHLLRYATATAERQEPWWYFIAVLAVGCGPWLAFAPWALVSGPAPGSERSGRPALFLAIWAGFVTVFFSASRSKLIPYVLPAVPALAVLAGMAVSRVLDRARRGSGARRQVILGAIPPALFAAALVWGGSGRVDRLGLGNVVTLELLIPGILAGAAVLAAVVCGWRRAVRVSVVGLGAAALLVDIGLLVAAPRLAGERSHKSLAVALTPEVRRGAEVYCYRGYFQTLPFYLGRTVGVVDYRGELVFGVERLSEADRRQRFPSLAEFQERWRRGDPLILVGERGRLAPLGERELPGARTVADRGSVIAVTNQR
jgi:4-amino-4-deoxy-L-arabinose transferase-like glycosyltransferase